MSTTKEKEPLINQLEGLISLLSTGLDKKVYTKNGEELHIYTVEGETVLYFDIFGSNWIEIIKADTGELTRIITFGHTKIEYVLSELVMPTLKDFIDNKMVTNKATELESKLSTLYKQETDIKQSIEIAEQELLRIKNGNNT